VLPPEVAEAEVEEVTTRAPESTADHDDDIQAPPVKTKPKTARFIVDITRSKPKRVQSEKRKKTFKMVDAKRQDSYTG
jgi:hypothetical protein